MKIMNKKTIQTLQQQTKELQLLEIIILSLITKKFNQKISNKIYRNNNNNLKLAYCKIF